MSLHLVLGAGPVGRATASQLAALPDHEVVLASRSGTGPAIAGVRRIALNAGDAAALTKAADGAAVIYNCMNPGNYTKWEQEWPPIYRAMIAAAERTGAVLAMVSNLYMYDPAVQPLRPNGPEGTPDHKGELRGRLDREVLEAHEAGRLRAVIVRASDYLGEGIGQNGMGTRLIEAAAKGKSVQAIGEIDLPHTWTYVPDVAATVIAAAAKPEALGRIWFAASNEPRTQRELLTELLASVGKHMVKISGMPMWQLTVIGWGVPLMREVKGISYQFTGPWLYDDSATRTELGVEPTPWAEVLRETALHNGAGAPATAGTPA
ncbi:NAD-dependent epimerase/dehydratase family protein [Gulosibacter sediminis]|uniref:NAD-dependent epimerase/dehydratase family protein n=1 Tax=Gulosibacter sediminis TaxID=1729695 RepID=UPI0024A846B1|nr:NAD-dependent epimerase/dehydratase family protein [Gulosibacter sediminis]